MLALLVWKGMKVVGRFGQQGWAVLRGGRDVPAAGEPAERALKET
jgi:hypothetical protein